MAVVGQKWNDDFVTEEGKTSTSVGVSKETLMILVPVLM
jgi:hypothetical protein